MAKKLFIAEKPSVAQEFAKALKYQMSRRDGYLESEEAIVTWCVGHLVTMSYPEVYDICLLYTSRANRVRDKPEFYPVGSRHFVRLLSTYPSDTSVGRRLVGGEKAHAIKQV